MRDLRTEIFWVFNKLGINESKLRPIGGRFHLTGNQEMRMEAKGDGRRVWYVRSLRHMLVSISERDELREGWEEREYIGGLLRERERGKKVEN